MSEYTIHEIASKDLLKKGWHLSRYRTYIAGMIRTGGIRAKLKRRRAGSETRWVVSQEEIDRINRLTKHHG